MSRVTFKIVRPSGTPADTHANVGTGLTGDLQPAPKPVILTQEGETTDRYFRLFCDTYTSDVESSDFVITVDSEGAEQKKYGITEVDDWEDEQQLDLKLVFVEEL